MVGAIWGCKMSPELVWPKWLGPFGDVKCGPKCGSERGREAVGVLRHSGKIVDLVWHARRTPSADRAEPIMPRDLHSPHVGRVTENVEMAGRQENPENRRRDVATCGWEEDLRWD